MRYAALIVILAAAPGAAQAELRPFCADRPGKASPTCIVDAGHLQLEVAPVDALLAHGDDERSVAWGATELRFGLGRRLEAEANWTPTITAHEPDGATDRGAGDGMLGLRWALTDPDKEGGVAASAEGHLILPLASGGRGEGGWGGVFRLPLSAAGPAGLGLGATPEVDVIPNASGSGAHLALSAAMAVSRSFGATSIGAELWGQVDDDPAGRTRQATFDLTLAQAIGRNTQIDGGANFGLNHDTPATEVYFGLAHRF